MTRHDTLTKKGKKKHGQELSDRERYFLVKFLLLGRQVASGRK